MRRVKTMARRRRTYSRPRKRYFRRAKGFSISLLDLAKYSVMYGILTNQPLGSVIQSLINSIMSGDDSFIDIILDQVNKGIENIMARPIQIAIQEAVVAYAFSMLKKAVGSKKIISVGKFSIRV